MKTCPHCKELLGDNVKICFNCNFNFDLGRVVDAKVASTTRREEEQEQQRKIEETKVKQEQLQQSKEVQLPKNPMYEYDVVAIDDLSNGTADLNLITFEINHHAEEGWQLKQAFTNEIGKSSSTIILNTFGMAINATIDQTILIFERCIKPGEK